MITVPLILASEGTHRPGRSPLFRSFTVVAQWYYSRDLEVSGPYCDKELADLAGAGTILPTDTVWKEGVEQGTLAHRVRHLFPLTVPSQRSSVVLSVAEDTLTSTEFQTDPVVAPTGADLVPPQKAELTTPAKTENPTKPTSGRSRAVAGKGVVIVGQDGKTVRYRMKCLTCGVDDSSWKCMLITRGTMRVSFFCRKCRKQRLSDIQGHMN